MRYILIIAAFLAFAGCQQTPQKPADQVKEQMRPTGGTFGGQVATDKAITALQITTLFTESDTVACTVSGNISASCKHSGCWMDLDMGNNSAVHVTFAEEAFTIPLDAAGKNAIAQGTAIRELIPVEKLQNWAREEGKSEAEIAAITEPLYAYEFIATGVLIEE